MKGWIRRNPIWAFGISLVVTWLRQVIEFVEAMWSIFSDRPLADLLAEKVGPITMSAFSWVILITFPLGIVLLAIILYVTRQRKVHEAAPSEAVNDSQSGQSYRVLGRDLLEGKMLWSLWSNGYFIKQANKPDTIFSFSALQAQEGGLPIAYNISRPKGTPHILNIESGLTILPNDQAAIRKMAPTERSALLSDLQQELARAPGIAYEGVGEPLQTISINRRVLLNQSFNEDSFYVQELLPMVKTFALIKIVLDKYLLSATSRNVEGPQTSVSHPLQPGAQASESSESWSDEQLGQKLRDWAYEGGYSVSKSASVASGESFRFVAQQEFVINVIGMSGVIRTLILWQVDQAYGGQIGALSPEDRQELRDNLTLELTRHGIEFAIPNDLSSVTFTGQIPHDDALTQHSFMDHLFFIRRARSLAGQTVSQFLKVSPND